MKVYHIELPAPPSANTHWRRGPNRSKDIEKRRRMPVITHISRKGKEYRVTVGKEFLAAGLPTLHGRLRVAVLYCAPDKRARDVMNYEKPLIDALEAAGAFDDDSQIDDFRIVRGPVVKFGKAIVLYHEIAAGPPTQESLFEDALLEDSPF